MTPGRITRRARREYVAILRDHLRALLRDIESGSPRAEMRAVDDLRRILEECGEEHATTSASGLKMYRGPRPLRLRIVVDPTNGDVLSVLPRKAAQKGGKP